MVLSGCIVSLMSEVRQRLYLGISLFYGIFRCLRLWYGGMWVRCLCVPTTIPTEIDCDEKQNVVWSDLCVYNVIFVNYRETASS